MILKLAHHDELRQYLLGGIAGITPGVAALGQAAVERIVKRIAVYDRFLSRERSIRGARFRCVRDRRVRVLFKIDYFDKILQHVSPDPADPAVTEQVITIMLAKEY